MKQKKFIFDIERSGFDHKLITLEKQEDLENCNRSRS